MFEHPPNLTLPGNPRYQPQQLQKYFGYDNIYGFVAEVEIANLKILAERQIMPPETFKLLTPEVEKDLLSITTTAVDKTEREITGHDIRAWIMEAEKVTPAPLSRWLHIMLTSYDPIETGRALQFLRAHREVVAPLCASVLKKMAQFAKDNAEVLQIGRTHGQHALPITVGFWLATILHRMNTAFFLMESAAGKLEGKISGAVGAYNAQVGLGAEDKLGGFKTYESDVLVLLDPDLEPALISTQILPPEPLAAYLFSCVLMSGAMAQFGTDCRQLMRSEIGEISEEFGATQSGSSTMAHKRNPVSFEQLIGMHTRTLAEFSKVLQTLISEHQRDLTGSSVYRDFPIIVVNLVVQLNTLLRKKKDQSKTFLERITVNRENCRRNFEASAGLILSEPLYICLQMAGLDHAHHVVNHELVPRAQKSGQPLKAIAEQYAAENAEFKAAWENIPPEQRELLGYPEGYIGRAEEKVERVLEETARLVGGHPIPRS